MIKGVNKQMLEITQTGSPYFERAFLVVRSGDCQPTQEQLQTMADKVVRQAETYAGLRKQHRRQKCLRILQLLAAGTAGAVLFWAVQQLLP